MGMGFRNKQRWENEIYRPPAPLQGPLYSTETLDLAFRILVVHQHFIFLFVIYVMLSPLVLAQKIISDLFSFFVSHFVFFDLQINIHASKHLQWHY